VPALIEENGDDPTSTTHARRPGAARHGNPYPIFLAGNVWSVIVPNALALAAMAALFLGITWRKSRKRLE
jgi:hypothetical protein